MTWRATTLIVALLVMGCRKNPIERLTDPNSDGVVPQSSGVFTLYDDELKTGGGLALIPSGENQSIDLANREDPRNAGTHIKYVWNGQPVGGQQLFAGFFLCLTPDGSTLAAASPKNFSSAGYTKLKMRLRGSLGAGNTLRIEGPTNQVTVAAQPTTAPTLTDGWQDFSFSVPSSDFASVKVFVTFSIQYTQPPRTTAPGTGGVIYIDDLRYEK